MSESILLTIKKLIGLGADYTDFDMDIIVHINSVLMILNQLGVGPIEGFAITGPDETWEDFIGYNEPRLNSIRTYIYLRVKLLFDPPQTATLFEAFKNQYQELEFRLNVEVDPGDRP